MLLLSPAQERREEGSEKQQHRAPRKKGGEGGGALSKLVARGHAETQELRRTPGDAQASVVGVVDDALRGLVLNAGLVEVVPADRAGVGDEVPRPHRHHVPFLHPESKQHKGTGGSEVPHGRVRGGMGKPIEPATQAHQVALNRIGDPQKTVRAAPKRT